MTEDILERAKAQFDVNRAKEAANRFAEWLLHNPAGTVDISDAALSVWGYPAAVAEVERLRSAVAHYKQELSKLVEVANAENRRNYGRIEEKDARIKEFYGELTAKIESARRCRDSERKTLNDNLMLKARIKELSDLNEALMENGNDLRERCQKAEGRCQELQDLIDKPPEEADWVADYHLLQSALDGPIIDAARKWHAAYRKAQNSNLMREKEVKRLRSREADPQRMSQ